MTLADLPAWAAALLDEIPVGHLGFHDEDGHPRVQPVTFARVADTLVSGLVPLEISANARRMLSVFTGQNTQVGFTVATRTGRTRALSKDFERGIVGFDLSADGRRILAHTGGWDPAAPHDVVTVPYLGGEPKVIVEDAAYPDWTR